MSTITLENVTYRYRNAESAAVKSVSTVFVPGKLYAVIGPSAPANPRSFPCWQGWTCPPRERCSATGGGSGTWIWTDTGGRKSP